MMWWLTRVIRYNLVSDHAHIIDVDLCAQQRSIQFILVEIIAIIIRCIHLHMNIFVNLLVIVLILGLGLKMILHLNSSLIIYMFKRLRPNKPQFLLQMN